MRIHIIIVCIALLFLLGCVEQGIKVIHVTNGGGTVPVVAPSNNTAAQPAPSSNQTANQTAANQSTAPASNATAPAGQGTPTKADLAVSNFLMSTIYPLPGEDFDVSFKIKNVGTESIKNFAYNIKIMKGNDVIKSEDYPYNTTIDAGGLTSKIGNTYNLNEGIYALTLTLDSGNAFKEPDESNNIKKQTFSAQQVISSNESSTATHSSSNSSRNSSSSNSSSNSGCTDTDGGANYNVKGICTDRFGQNIGDICLDVNKLWEWSCVSGRCVYAEHTCSCLEGKCV